MNAFRIRSGQEHGVKWTVDPTKVDPAIISVETEDGLKKETYLYKLTHPNCPFGYDVSDWAQIEKKLEDLIVKYANDGYGLVGTIGI